jgi:hypothetical protein
MITLNVNVYQRVTTLRSTRNGGSLTNTVAISALHLQKIDSKKSFGLERDDWRIIPEASIL